MLTPLPKDERQPFGWSEIKQLVIELLPWLIIFAMVGALGPMLRVL